MPGDFPNIKEEDYGAKANRERIAKNVRAAQAGPVQMGPETPMPPPMPGQPAEQGGAMPEQGGVVPEQIDLPRVPEGLMREAMGRTTPGIENPSPMPGEFMSPKVQQLLHSAIILSDLAASPGASESEIILAELAADQLLKELGVSTQLDDVLLDRELLEKTREVPGNYKENVNRMYQQELLNQGFDVDAKDLDYITAEEQEIEGRPEVVEGEPPEYLQEGEKLEIK